MVAVTQIGHEAAHGSTRLASKFVQTVKRVFVYVVLVRGYIEFALYLGT